LATNHVAGVALETWIESLKRCADKAGRPLRSVEHIPVEADFPSLDAQPPLKIVVCEA
jgi:23S rRNA (cytosine1962-C5)-methyltransferase